MYSCLFCFFGFTSRSNFLEFQLACFMFGDIYKPMRCFYLPDLAFCLIVKLISSYCILDFSFTSYRYLLVKVGCSQQYFMKKSCCT